jgi:hypothetical protein
MKKLLLFCFLIVPFFMNGQVNLNISPYTQDFNALATSGSANTWTNNSTITGWYSNRTVYISDNGTLNSGGQRCLGATSATERALGSLGSGSANPVLYGVLLTNNTGQNLSALTITYKGEQWRSSTSTQNKLTFSYKVAATTITETGFTNITNLDYTGATPVTANGAIDGNANAITITYNLPVSIAVGQTIMLRWSDIDDAGSDAALAIDDLSVTAIPASPSITTNPTSLTNLNYFTGMGPSTAGSFTLSGSALTPLADNITVTAPTNFEISTTSATAGFADNFTIAYTGGGFSSTIYARLKTGLADATYNGNVTYPGGGVTTPTTHALSGTVSPPVPTITLSPTSLTGLTYVVGTGPSTGSAYSVSGMFLSPAADNISIVAPTNFEISTTLAGTYADNLTIPYTANTLPSTTLYVRLKIGLAQNSYSGNIAHTGGGVITAINEAVSGVVTAVGTGACGTSTPIGTAKLNLDPTVVTVQGRLSVDTEFGPNLIYIQDGNGTAGTGGIAIYFASGNAALGSSINTGDEVQVTGPLSTFNGKREMANPTCFVKTSAPNLAVTPFVINISEISMHEGELVKIDNATVGDEIPLPTVATTKFVGGKNYSFSTASPSATAELRIDLNTLLPNTLRPTTITSVAGVVDHYKTTVAPIVDKYQLYPRDVDDIPGTTGGGGGAGACTTLGFATVPVAQTLEVTAWNVEWLGNTTAGAKPLGPTNDAQQMTNVITVLNTLQSDVYCLEEVCDQNQFIARVGTDMPGYGVKCSTTYYSHFFDDPDVPGDATSYAQKVCFVYKTAVVSPIIAETKALLSNAYVYTPPPTVPVTPAANNWASGRLPFMFVADVTVNAMTKKMNFVGFHGKALSDITSYNRRKQDAIDLKNELDTNYPTANIVMLGDYNDDLDVSITTGQPSGYANFVNDNTNYVQISKALSDCGVSSTAKYSDIIDHMMASNEIGVLPVTGTPPPVPSSGIYYLQNTVNVARPISYIPSYTTSTSDHYPVTSRFSFGIPVSTTPATITSTTNGNWSSASTWDCNCIPTSASDVVINTGNTVTVNVTAQAKSLNIKGILNWLSAFTLTLGM